MQKHNSVPKNNLTTIDPTAVLIGKCTGSHNILIEGRVEGEVKTDGDVNIGPSAKIDANLKANNVSNAGVIKGNINVKEKLEIQETGRINGSVKYKFLNINPGAILNGKCTYESDSKEAAHSSAGKLKKREQTKIISNIIKVD